MPTTGLFVKPIAGGFLFEYLRDSPPASFLTTIGFLSTRDCTKSIASSHMDSPFDKHSDNLSLVCPYADSFSDLFMPVVLLLYFFPSAITSTSQPSLRSEMAISYFIPQNLLT